MSDKALLGELKTSFFLFFVVIFIVVFLALYVKSTINDNREIPVAQTHNNIEPHGRLYPREPQ